MSVERFRFGVGVGDRLLSSPWVIFCGKNDLYMGLRNMAHTLKLSIHGSGVCHFALTSRFWESGMKDALNPPSERALIRWHRAEVPRTGAAEVVSVLFPRDHQSLAGHKPPSKSFHLVPPAPSGMAVRVAIAESMEDPHTLELKLRRFGVPVGYYRFDDGRSLSVVMRPEPFDEPRLEKVRSGIGSGTTFDPSALPTKGETLKGFSMLALTAPRDGQPLHITEMHGISLSRAA